jgi:hypothetical protein
LVLCEGFCNKLFDSCKNAKSPLSDEPLFGGDKDAYCAEQTYNPPSGGAEKCFNAATSFTYSPLLSVAAVAVGLAAAVFRF